jgi:hypothetical protein
MQPAGFEHVITASELPPRLAKKNSFNRSKLFRGFAFRCSTPAAFWQSQISTKKIQPSMQTKKQNYFPQRQSG